MSGPNYRGTQPWDRDPSHPLYRPPATSSEVYSAGKRRDAENARRLDDLLDSEEDLHAGGAAWSAHLRAEAARAAAREEEERRLYEEARVERERYGRW